MLPFYETRVTELLEELKRRDLEVQLLKEELKEVNERAKATLVEGLLWDDDDDNDDNDKEGGEGGEEEDEFHGLAGVDLPVVSRRRMVSARFAGSLILRACSSA